MKPRHDFENFSLGTDFSSIKVNKDRSSTELALIYCYQCKYENQSDAYACKYSECPLYPIKNKYMRKPHKLNEEYRSILVKRAKGWKKDKNI